MEITLNSNQYQVKVNTLGAELKSFTTPEKTEFIWNSNPEFWMRSSPLLFPTIGNVRENKTHYNGVAYPLMKHGFCKETEFEVLGSGDDFVTFVLRANDETRKYYPFYFELHLTYQLKDNKLSMIYKVYNQGTEVMPYHLGAHPGFMCPLFDGEKLSDYQIEFEKEEHLEATIYDLEHLCFSSTKKKRFAEQGKILPLNASMFDDDAVYFPHTNSHQVLLINPATKKGIKMEYPGFASIAFWTPMGGNAPFLCLEPWNGAAIYDDEDDEFTHKRDIETLQPNTSKEYELIITLLDK